MTSAQDSIENQVKGGEGKDNIHRFWSLRYKAGPSSGLLLTMPIVKVDQEDDEG